MFKIQKCEDIAELKGQFNVSVIERVMKKIKRKKINIIGVLNV